VREEERMGGDWSSETREGEGVGGGELGKEGSATEGNLAFVPRTM
jgi:hypothetical protein